MSAQRLELSIALSDNPRTRPIHDGEVTAEGIRLVPTMLHPSEMFWRQLKFAEFDVSEMSMSSLVIAVARGETRWVGIPVFTTRYFFHTRVLMRTDRGIELPADLKGKRIGVPEYQQTAAIWARGVLQHEFGVHARDMEWWMERTPERSHGGATGFTAPDGVTVNRIPADSDIGEMLADGRLDATLLYLRERNLVDRSKLDVTTVPEIRPLFVDRAAEQRRYFAKTGIYPINHAMVVRRSILEAHPWVALNIYAAMLAAKEAQLAKGMAIVQPWLDAGLLGSEAAAGLAVDPLAYGVKAARPVLETITRYVHEQGLADRRVALDELFAPSTMDV